MAEGLRRPVRKLSVEGEASVADFPLSVGVAGNDGSASAGRADGEALDRGVAEISLGKLIHPFGGLRR